MIASLDSRPAHRAQDSQGGMLRQKCVSRAGDLKPPPRLSRGSKVVRPPRPSPWDSIRSACYVRSAFALDAHSLASASFSAIPASHP